MTTQMFIDGAWADAASGATIEATSPATGESLGPVAWGDREDARRAIAAANAAFRAWEARTAFERAAMLHRVADVMERRSDELARMNTLDQGKPLVAEADRRGRGARAVLPHGGRGRRPPGGHDRQQRRARPAGAADPPAAGHAGADHAVELAVHDARRGARPRAGVRQLRGLDARAVDRRVLRR